MSVEGPRLAQVNLIVGDTDAAVAFYERLGMTVRFAGMQFQVTV